MICPLLEAIEIIDDATAIFDNMLSKKPPEHGEAAVGYKPGMIGAMTYSEHVYPARIPRLRDFGLRIDWLTNNTDCPSDLVDSIGDLVMGMVENRRLPRWETRREVIGSALHSPEAVAQLQADK